MRRVYGIFLFVLAILVVGAFAYSFFPALISAYGFGRGDQGRVIREVHAEMDSYCKTQAQPKPDIYIYQQANNVLGFQIDYDFKNGCGAVCKWALLYHEFEFVEVENDGYGTVSTLVNEPGLFRMTLIEDPEADGSTRAECKAFYNYRNLQVESSPPQAKERLRNATPSEIAKVFHWPPEKCIAVERIDKPQARYVLRERPVEVVTKISHGQIRRSARDIYDRDTDKILAETIQYNAPILPEPVGAPPSCKPPNFPVTGIDLVKNTLIKPQAE